MTKQDILDYFSLIDFAYNESGRLESLSRMLDELLKEQEDEIAKFCGEVARLTAMLKEQEAVKPKSKSRHGEYPQIVHRCGNCNEILYRHYKFCPMCGRSVKWE